MNNVLREGNRTLYAALIAFSFVILLFLWEIGWWMISARMMHIHPLLYHVLNLGVQFIAVAFIISMILLMLQFSKIGVRKLSGYQRWFFMNFYMAAYRIGRLLRLEKEKLAEAFIFINNLVLENAGHRYSASELLILLPHCLQVQTCDRRITSDIRNCRECGGCDLKELKAIAEEHNVRIFVATGGTLARRIIVNEKPRFIIAVACHRDLVIGIKEAYPVPVFGIMNERPNGPCYNTVVDTVELRRTIDFFTKQ